MTLKECYEAMDAGYGDVMGRLRSEAMVQKFVLKFLNDPSYQLLVDAMEAGNYEDAFRAAHTIKGVCQNLSFTGLAQSSSALTEALRPGADPKDPALLEQVKEDYQKTVSAIRALQASL